MADEQKVGELATSVAERLGLRVTWKNLALMKKGGRTKSSSTLGAKTKRFFKSMGKDIKTFCSDYVTESDFNWSQYCKGNGSCDLSVAIVRDDLRIIGVCFWSDWYKKMSNVKLEKGSYAEIIAVCNDKPYSKAGQLALLAAMELSKRTNFILFQTVGKTGANGEEIKQDANTLPSNHTYTKFGFTLHHGEGFRYWTRLTNVTEADADKIRKGQGGAAAASAASQPASVSSESEADSEEDPEEDSDSDPDGIKELLASKRRRNAALRIQLQTGKGKAKKPVALEIQPQTGKGKGSKKPVDPSKKRRKPRRRGWKSYNYKVLKQIHPDTGITRMGMQVMSDMVQDIFERISEQADFIRKINKKSTTTAREVQTAVRLILPGELAKHAVSEGTMAVTRFKKSYE